MTNILRLTLQKNEDKLACIIIAYYEVALDELMLANALANNKYEWLMFVWGFDKNYLGSKYDD